MGRRVRVAGTIWRCPDGRASRVSPLNLFDVRHPSTLVQFSRNIGTGLLLGGGSSYLAPENGWSTDAITEMDIVLVNGQQVTATATNQYSDLFRALKGGGSRFGVVTRFEIEPVRVGRRTDKNWYGGLILVSHPVAFDFIMLTLFTPLPQCSTPSRP